MVTLDDALQYMGIDYADAAVASNVTRAMAAAERLMQGAVGDNARALLPSDERIDELVLIYTDDLYSERGINAKVSNATRVLVSDLVQQLQMEYRRAASASEEVGS